MRLPEDPPLLVADSVVTGTGPDVEFARGIADTTAFHFFHEMIPALPRMAGGVRQAGRVSGRGSGPGTRRRGLPVDDLAAPGLRQRQHRPAGRSAPGAARQSGLGIRHDVGRPDPAAIHLDGGSLVGDQPGHDRLIGDGAVQGRIDDDFGDDFPRPPQAPPGGGGGGGNRGGGIEAMLGLRWPSGPHQYRSLPE